MPQTSSTERRQIAALVSRLLSHYWTADDREETRESQIEDWITDLHQFGAEVVSRACGRWRLTQNRRPTPADIVKLAIEERDTLGIEHQGSTSGKKPYAAMTDDEKRAWHTDVYAFRRVCLGIFEQTSPCDTKGKWYDPIMVDEAERTKRAGFAKRRGGTYENSARYARGAYGDPLVRKAEGTFKSIAEALGVTASEEGFP